jgi:hypothetical protein
MTLHLWNNDGIRRMHKAASFVLACFLMAAMAGTARADEHTYKVEAVFLYNFFNYITWPGYHAPEDMKQATICLAANDPVYAYLEYIQHKKQTEREFSIRQMDSGTSLAGCQILFIRDVSDSELSTLHSLAAQNSVLLVSTKPDFVDGGGMIGLLPEGERMAIEIDNSELKQANFQVSSRLLDLARKVK